MSFETKSQLAHAYVQPLFTWIYDATNSCAAALNGLLIFIAISVKASLLPWTVERTPPSPTSFLDGLRGFAAIVVSLYHLRDGYTESVHIGYSTKSSDTSWLQLPILRLIFAGSPMVTIFFLVSGYTLALGSFKDMQAGNTGKCLERIRSSILRRFLRLYLPTITSTFIVMICIRLGLYEKSRLEDQRSKFREPEPMVFQTTAEQLSDWLRETGSVLENQSRPRKERLLI